jgi:tetratricopeptide (TPR) repeat protein
MNGEETSLYNIGLTLTLLDQHDEALEYLQKALTINQNLGLDHKIEKCKQVISKLNQKKEKSLARKRLQKYGLWFVAGLALTILIWYLKK